MTHAGVLFPTAPGTVRYGHSALTDHLAGDLTERGCSRVFVVTSPSVAMGAGYQMLISALGPKHVGTFGRTVPHVPREIALEAGSAVRSAACDAVVAIGGGSSIDTAKAALVANAIGATNPGDFDQLPDHFEWLVLKNPVPPLIAVPTTLAGPEYSSVGSLTNQVTAHKQVFRAGQLVSSLVLLDPQVTVHTPRRLWAETATKALSDVIDLACSGVVNPIVEPFVYRSIEWIVAGLAADRDGRESARLQAHLGRWMGSFALHQSGRSSGLGAAFRHVLGPALGLPHGGISAMALPHIYRFNGAAIPRHTHEAIADSLQASGNLDPEDRVVAGLIRLRESNGLRGCLADFGVALSDGEIPELADRIIADVAHLANPRANVTVDEIAQILREIR